MQQTPAPVEKKKRRKRRGMLGLPAGIPALIVLVGAVALGRMAADDYAEGPIQRVSVVAMVVSVPFCVWGLFNTMFYHCLLYTSPSPRDRQKSRMPSSA